VRPVVALVAVALALRLGYALLAPQPVAVDAIEYDLLARSVAAGRGYEISPGVPAVSRGPLYPLALAAVYVVVGPDPRVARGVQAVAGALVCIATAVLAGRLFGHDAALAAAAVAAVWPALVIYPSLLLTETLAGAVLIALTLLIARDATDASWWRWLVCGALGGAGALLRQEFLALPIVGTVAVSIVYRSGWRRAAAWMGAAAVGTAVVVLPWTARNYAATGALVPIATGAGTSLWLAAHPADVTDTPGNRRSDYPEFMAVHDAHAEDIARDRALWHAGLANLLRHPVRYVVNAGKRLQRLWLSTHTHMVPALSETFPDAWRAGHAGVVAVKAGFGLVHVAFLVLGVAGFAAALVDGPARGTVALALVPVLYCSFVYAATFSTARYQVPLLPIVAAGAGYGVTLLRGRMGMR
jgi:4-amino-4-deoxy-L-arabinose transferase-like glycosyltransferase